MSAGTAVLVDAIEKFLRRYYDEEIKELASKYPQEERSLYVDWLDIYQFNDRENDIDALGDDVLQNPDQMQEYFEEALRQYDLPIDLELGNAHVRFKNVPETQTYDIGEFSPSRKDGELLAISGQVSKTSKVEPIPNEIAYECQMCGTITRVPARNGFEEPHECQGCERQGPFVENSHQSEKEDYQLIRISQPPEQTNGQDGQDLDVRVRDDLVRCVDPGDRVDFVGKFCLERPPSTSDKKTYDMVVEGQAAEVKQTDFEEIEVDDDLEEIIKRIASGEFGDPFEILVGSIAPTIHGHDKIKESLALSLFSGVRVEHGDGTATRGDIHILMIGDPGTAKTTLLDAVSQIAPRSVRASGQGASVSGMTAAAVRDEFGEGQWSLDAGALVIGHQGVATIDEIDKLPEGVEEAMHDAMASQTVSVNKAGINTTLEAQTSVIAAGNPKYGRYDRYEPMGEQIEIGSTLLSRFDLVFPLTDQPDEERDRKIAKTIYGSKEAAKRDDSDSEWNPEIEDIINQLNVDYDPLEVLRAWIAYAKRNIDPVIDDDEVSEKLEESYVSLRLANGTDEDEPVPITARKLEGLQRLAESSARARLSHTVEMQDIMRAKDLIGTSLRQIGMDEESEKFDADIVESDTSTSQRRRIKELSNLIREMQKEYDRRAAPVDEVVDRAISELNAGKNQTEHDIQDLKDKGELYEKEEGWIRKID